MNPIRTLGLAALLGLCAPFAITSCKSEMKNAENASEERADDVTEAAQQNNENVTGNPDATFVTEAGAGGNFKLQCSRLVLGRAVGEASKSFAQRMIEDHTKTSDDLKAVAQSKNLVVPTTVSENQQEDYNRLNRQSDINKFEKQYAELMVEAHKRDVKQYEKQVKNGKDTELRQLASDILPKLKEHLEMAEKNQDVMKEMK